MADVGSNPEIRCYTLFDSFLTGRIVLHSGSPSSSASKSLSLPKDEQFATEDIAFRRMMSQDQTINWALTTNKGFAKVPSELLKGFR